MKKYIIITSTIGRMGGAQMYVENKLHYLKANGWEVQIFYYLYAEKILLPGLAGYRDNYSPELGVSISSLPKCKIKKVIDKIENIVKPSGDHVIVESQLVGLALWGELVAKRLHARHVLNLLEERIPLFNEKEHLFYEDKLIKRDILNASIPRIKSIFASRFKNEYSNYTRSVIIPCTNVVSDSLEIDCRFDKCDFTILSIGRLDKPYIMGMVEEIVIFAKANPSLTINLICIGGSSDGSKEGVIQNMVKDSNNLKLYLLGYVYPVSRQLILQANASIACANSILVSANEGIPTIAIDTIDNMAIGVYGHTTMEKFKRNDEPQQRVSVLLQQIKDGDYPRDKYKNSGNDEMESAFINEFNYVLDNYHTGPYYDVYSICSPIKHILLVIKYLNKTFFLDRMINLFICYKEQK